MNETLVDVFAVLACIVGGGLFGWYVAGPVLSELINRR